MIVNACIPSAPALDADYNVDDGCCLIQRKWEVGGCDFKLVDEVVVADMVFWLNGSGRVVTGPVILVSVMPGEFMRSLNTGSGCVPGISVFFFF